MANPLWQPPQAAFFTWIEPASGASSPALMNAVSRSCSTLRVVAVLGLGAGDELHRVGGGERVGERAEHEVHAPHQLVPGQLGQRPGERRLEALHGRGVHLADQRADRLGRLGIGAAEQAGEIASAAARVLDHAQARADEGADDGVRRERLAGGLLLQPVELGDALGVHRVQAPAEHRLDERVLRAEVVVDGGEVDAGLGGQHAHRGALEAVLHEQLLGGVEDAGLGFGLGLDGAQGHGIPGFKRTFEC